MDKLGNLLPRVLARQPGRGRVVEIRVRLAFAQLLGTELAGFCDELLSRGSTQDNLPTLVAHRRRLRRRLAFWRRRELETRTGS